MIKKSGKSSKLKKSSIKSAFFAIFKVREWLDWNRVRAAGLYLKSSIRKLFAPVTEGKSESFEQAIEQFHLTEEDLLIKQNALLRLSFLMVFMAVLIFIYFCYQLFFGSLIAAFLSLVVIGIALVLAFRYHFWYFQIKHRRLGCSFGEWYKAFRGGKNE